MKKLFYLLSVCLMCFSLLGCKNQENTYEEGKVILINVKELLEIYDLDSNILYATLSKNSDDYNYDELLNVLEDYAKQTNNNIYLIDTTDINLIESEYIDVLTDSDFSLPNLYSVNKGTLELNITITSNVSDIISKLGNKKYDKVDMGPLLYERNNNFEDGFDLLANGKIGESYAKIHNALPKEEAKMLLEDENLYNLINSWETNIKKGDNCTYLSLNFAMKTDKVYRSYYNGKCSEFSKLSLDLVGYDYYTDGKVIYTKLPLEKDYKKMYTIVKLDKENFKIKSKEREYNMTLLEGA